MARSTTGREDRQLTSIVKDTIGTFTFDDVLSFIQSEFQPEEVYDSGELDEWALKNGYVKEVKS